MNIIDKIENRQIKLLFKIFFLFLFLSFHFPSTVYSAQIIGEAGTKAVMGNDFESVSINSNYYDSTPLVFTTTQTYEGPKDPSLAKIKNVTTSGFDTQHCEYHLGCDSMHTTETNGWLALDPDKIQNTKGMDGGITTISGNNTVEVFFHKTFVNTPIVFAQVISAGVENINAKITGRTTNRAAIKLCEQNSANGCNGLHGSETVAWLAIDPQVADKLSSWDWGTVTCGDASWESVSYSLSSTPIVIVETQTENSSEHEMISEANNISSTGAQIRFCETDGSDVCTSHVNETCAWLAVLPGDVEGASDFRPTGLQVEGQSNPIDLTTNQPSFAATYNDITTGDIADYYQLQISEYPQIVFHYNTYNFSSCSPGSNCWAYEKGGSQPSSPIDYTSIAESADYTSISSMNDSRWTTSLSLRDSTYDSQIFSFQISESVSDINDMIIEWQGYGETEPSYFTYFKIWNNTTDSWEELSNTDFISQSDLRLNATKSSSIGDYVDINSKVHLMINSQNYIPEESSYCSDGIDNDGDGCTDGLDSDCGGTESNCSDGIDNDCDGYTDGDDLDCGGDPCETLTCTCDGTGYETLNCANGDTIYVDCNADICWTSTAGSTYDRTGAIDYCSNLSYGGKTDWNLPLAQPLIDLCNSASCSNACFGGDGGANNYWSSSTGGFMGMQKYTVRFTDCVGPWTMVDELHYVRCEYIGNTPYLYTYKQGKYRKLTDFLAGAVSKDKEKLDFVDISQTNIEEGKIKLKISEEIEETTFIDRIYLRSDNKGIIELSSISGDINSDLLKQSDNKYLVMKKGDEFFLEFKAPENYEKLEFAVEGYYTKEVEKYEQKINKETEKVFESKNPYSIKPHNSIHTNNIKLTVLSTPSLIWDSGKTSITNCTQGTECTIDSAVPELPRDKTYYWRVKFWDDADQEGNWSTEESSFSFKEGCPEFSSEILYNCTYTNNLGTNLENNNTIVGLHELDGTVNNSSLSIASGKTLTINADQELIVGSIDLSGDSGSIVILDGGKIKPGATLWYPDNDNDGYASNDNTYLLTDPGDNRIHQTEILGYDDPDDNNACITSLVNHQCGDGDLDGNCIPLPAGEYELPACQRCNGTSIDPVNITDDTQDTEGSNLCNQECKKCSGGSCINQTGREDLFNQCPDGNCNGDGSLSCSDCGGSISYGGVTYPLVAIGNQCWLGNVLNIDPTSADNANCSGTKYCYDDNSTNCNTYGGLYTWTVAMCGASSSSSSPSGVQGLCPDGWHFPSDAELTTLENNVCGDEGSALAGQYDLWPDNDLRSDNDFGCSGFDLLPGGRRNTDGSYFGISNFAYLWSSTEYDSSNAWGRSVYYSSTGVSHHGNDKGKGFSVRCLRD